MIDQRSGTVVSHRDIGIGVSQVLPVLVGAYAAQNQIIAIEQPEIHLHPALKQIWEMCSFNQLLARVTIGF